MAIDVCSEISSPRISFSHDLNEFDFVPVESQIHRSDFDLDRLTIDFDFCVAGILSHEISPADELFANGKILPVQIKEVPIAQPKPDTRKLDPDPDPVASSKTLDTHAATNKKRLIEFLSAGFDDDDDDEDQEKLPPKPFWQFRRSSSDNSRANGLLRSLQFLTRSNSTGSVPNSKPHPKGIQKQHSLKETSSSINHHHHHHHHRLRPNSSMNSHSYYPYYNNSSRKQQPSLRKSSSSRSYGVGNGVRVNPVLNIPPSYIAKGTVSLFGFGSFFCSKNFKKKRK